MSAPNDPSACPPVRLRPICLIRSDQRWVASPAKGECSAGRGFAPFALRPPDRFLLDWLAVAGQRVWQERRRCVLALLLVDCRTANWTLRLPAQRCGADSAVLDGGRADDPAGLPASLRIGGSFQTLARGGGDQSASAAPAWPGFHFALALDGTEPPLNACVRYGDRLIRLELPAALTDDWARAIAGAAARLRLV